MHERYRHHAGFRTPSQLNPDLLLVTHTPFNHNNLLEMIFTVHVKPSGGRNRRPSSLPNNNSFYSILIRFEGKGEEVTMMNGFIFDPPSALFFPMTIFSPSFARRVTVLCLQINRRRTRASPAGRPIIDRTRIAKLCLHLSTGSEKLFPPSSSKIRELFASGTT